MLKIGQFKLTGRVVKRRLNHHVVRVFEPTHSLTYDEASEKARKFLQK